MENQKPRESFCDYCGISIFSALRLKDALIDEWTRLLESEKHIKHCCQLNSRSYGM